jgi:hypothetical protein
MIYSPGYTIAPSSNLRTHFHIDHWDDLKKSSLEDGIIREAKVYSLSPNKIAHFFSFTGKKAYLPNVRSALCFPYTSMGFARIKVFPALTKMRYLQPPGTSARLYMPMALNKGKIIVCEGEKKTLAALQYGLNAVGIGGVWAWVSKGRAIDDLDQVEFDGADVEIVPDSDVWGRPDLLRAIYALGREIESRGAYIEIVKLTGKGKIGLDDYFVGGGTIEDYNKLDRIQLRQPLLKAHRSWYARWKANKAGLK